VDPGTMAIGHRGSRFARSTPDPFVARRTPTGSPTESIAASVPGSVPSRRPLRSSSLETIRSDLERQLLYSPEFVARYFPVIASRGVVSSGDVEGMSTTQADAMAFSLGRSIRCFAREEERQRLRRVAFPPLARGAPPPSKNTTKALAYVAALRDLCEAYRLEVLL